MTLGDKGDTRASLIGQWVSVHLVPEGTLWSKPYLLLRACLRPLRYMVGASQVQVSLTCAWGFPFSWLCARPMSLSAPAAPGVHPGRPSAGTLLPTIRPVQPWLACPSSLAEVQVSSPGSMSNPRTQVTQPCPLCGTPHMIVFPDNN